MTLIIEKVGEDVMFKILWTLLISMIFMFSATASIDYTSLDRLNNFFVEKNYRQAKTTNLLIKKVKQTQSHDTKLQLMRNFYTQQKANKRYAPKVKKYVLKEIKTFFKSLKKNGVKKVLAKAKTIPKAKVKAINLRPFNVKISPKIIKPKTVKAKQPSTESSFINNYALELNLAVFSSLGLFILLLWRRNLSLKTRILNVATYNETQSVDQGVEPLSPSLLNSMLSLSSGIMPGSFYILYDFSGSITKFSSNTKKIVGDQISVGMKWSDLVARHFHKIGNEDSSYYISLHNADKFFTMSTKSIGTLKTNLCQFVEIDKDMITQTNEYQDNYYLENPCSLVDIFEDSLSEASSFQEFNLIDNVQIDSKGNDTSFQLESDVERLFQSLSRTIKHVYEDEAPQTKVVFETFKERHIINVEMSNYQFESFQNPDSRSFVERIEDIKSSLENLGGSIVVKNLKGMTNKAVIQVIFDQVLQRDICIEEEFELQVL